MSPERSDYAVNVVFDEGDPQTFSVVRLVVSADTWAEAAFVAERSYPGTSAQP